jgi:hypothetical protein
MSRLGRAGPDRAPQIAAEWEEVLTETVYAVTSPAVTQARRAELGAIVRGHWLIEDRLHWVRLQGSSACRVTSRRSALRRVSQHIS